MILLAYYILPTYEHLLNSDPKISPQSTPVKDKGRLVFTDALSGVHAGEGKSSAENASEFSNSDEYIRKSSLVPKTCTTCVGGSGASADPLSSKSPGDMDIIKENTEPYPFPISIKQKTEPSSFLTSFASFGR